MKNFTLSDVEKLVDKHRDVIDFGSPEDAVSEEWFKLAEEALGLPLTSSYKNFLRHYVGGEIAGEEIYSIYGLNFEDAIGGDIVYQNLTDRKNGTANADELVVSETDFGEIFYFDYSQYAVDECPIYIRIPSGHSLHYAKNFYEYLCKRIEAHLD
ncbi:MULTISPECIES: SMI1/KNR4 family protein [Tenebrionibacter/Tenebrionicola group]|jgi:hypothetical protein|uniref:SMI1/KNR4 family protein n=2 Tax=Tenebrionibacter/Tenebrionicola group TaxID=2969848 RepID=A0A8K0V4Y9_9ENTR|nr:MULTISPECIES: SMI1/KNR4 family protein [Tenebrionibacter/Tenebrionicola group]MBK4717143.1 SMI1/KNR4 family protein [Tenebrionibacter intestinalis]MBV5097583.1 SMI1/KNR4 family protein [Tenebrionicola larvae]